MDELQQLQEAERQYNAVVRAAQDAAPRILRRLRRERGWTQAELAARLDCDPTYISRIECGLMRAGVPILLTLHQRLGPSLPGGRQS